MATRAHEITEAPQEQRSERDREDEQERLRQGLRSIVSMLAMDAEDRVSKRNLIEQRWLQDLRQYNSEYETDVLQDIKKADKSELFINQTRPKSNACEARLSDMLFPTDDDNWGIRPTPVPELADEAKAAADKVKEALKQANKQGENGDVQGQAQTLAAAVPFETRAGELKAEMTEANRRSDAMADEIRDQLKECQYAIQSRDVINDACQIGTGIMLGPIASTERSRRSWQKPEGSNVHELTRVEDRRPMFRRVDPWGFFPQTDALTIEDSESNFERFLKTMKGMRDLAKEPGFDKDAIRRVVEGNRQTQIPSYMSELRAIKGDNLAPTETRFTVWCYRGPLEVEQIKILCECTQNEKVAEFLLEDGSVDPLAEMNVVVWFSDDEVLKFGIHHLDSGETLYSVYNIEKDKASIWGYGIPYIMRNSQAALNGAWRMMMDNAGLSSGPQIVVDQSVIEPGDGIWSILARKIWLKKPEAPANKRGFETYEIPSHQGDLERIIMLAKQFIDDETAISEIAQGEQGAHTTQTKGGMAMLMNAVNVVFRRMVKGWDDDITVPNIRRIYDFNMQFSNKEHIKGDYEIDARGTSVLLVREVQSQNLMTVANNFAGHPVFGQLVKSAPLLRKLFQSMMIEADEVVLDDDEIKRMVDRQNQEPKPDPEQIKAEAAIALVKMKGDFEIQIETMRRDTAMMQLAQNSNLSTEEVRARFGIESEKIQSKERIEAEKSASAERIFAAEVGVEDRRAAQGEDVGQGIG